MPITIAGPQAAASAAIVDQVAYLLTSHRPTGRRLGAVAPEELALTATHPVYTATLADATAGSATSNAALTAWRGLVQDSTRVIATADATTGAAPTVTHITEGPHGVSMAAAIRKAERLPEVAANSYELRTFSAPALKVQALWLHGAQDVFIPLAPTGAGLRPGDTYTKAEFDQALQASAQTHADFPAGAIS